MESANLEAEFRAALERRLEDLEEQYARLPDSTGRRHFEEEVECLHRQLADLPNIVQAGAGHATQEDNDHASFTHYSGIELLFDVPERSASSLARDRNMPPSTDQAENILKENAENGDHEVNHIGPYSVAHLATLFENMKLDDLAAEIEHQDMGDPLLCHDLDCKTLISALAIDVVGCVGTCPTCHKDTCTLCKMKAHPNASCDDMLLERYLGEVGAQRCPNCGHAIELSYGCNHITYVSPEEKALQASFLERDH